MQAILELLSAAVVRVQHVRQGSTRQIWALLRVRFVRLTLLHCQLVHLQSWLVHVMLVLLAQLLMPTPLVLHAPVVAIGRQVQYRVYRAQLGDMG